MNLEKSTGDQNQCEFHLKFRQPTGICNNRKQPLKYGVAYTPFRRYARHFERAFGHIIIIDCNQFQSIESWLCRRNIIAPNKSYIDAIAIGETSFIVGTSAILFDRPKIHSYVGRFWPIPRSWHYSDCIESRSRWWTNRLLCCHEQRASRMLSGWIGCRWSELWSI